MKHKLRLFYFDFTVDDFADSVSDLIWTSGDSCECRSISMCDVLFDADSRALGPLLSCVD